MKIRNGFVSNSSTTSFQLYGLNLHHIDEHLFKYKNLICKSPYLKELKERLKTKPQNTSKYDQIDHFINQMSEILDEQKLYENGILFYYHPDFYISCIGNSVFQYDDSLSLRTIKDQIKAHTLKVLNLENKEEEFDKFFHVIVDSYYS